MGHRLADVGVSGNGTSVSSWRKEKMISPSSDLDARPALLRAKKAAVQERRDACQAFRWIARPKECISGTAVVRQSTSMPPTVSQERASWQGGEQPAPGLHADAR